MEIILLTTKLHIVIITPGLSNPKYYQYSCTDFYKSAEYYGYFQYY